MLLDPVRRPAREIGDPHRAGCRNDIFYILLYMKSVLIEIDNDTAARLDHVAPSRSRRRSEFIRNAIRRALWELEEQATAEAYRRQPDAPAAYLDAEAWEPGRAASRARGKRR